MPIFEPKVAFSEAPETFFGGFDALGGSVVVEIDLPIDKEGSLYLPESVKEDVMPDVGTVVAFGPEVEGLDPLERVLVAPKTGKTIENFKRLGRVHPGFTRFYGAAGGKSPFLETGDPAFSAFTVPWWVCVMATVLQDGTLGPKGDWLVLRHTVTETTGGGIYISGMRDPRESPSAEIVAVGPRCKEVAPSDVGRKVIYHEGAAQTPVGTEFGTVLVREPFVHGFVVEE